jgi:hypothetical protein
MNSKAIESVANAVLYEGYMLYPYRPSAVKNRQRWNFGVLYPKAYSDLEGGSDRWSMQTQCLIRGNEAAVVEIKVRFLQCVSREIGRPVGYANSELCGASEYDLVDSLDVAGKRLQSWQEAVEQEALLPPMRVADLLAESVQRTFSFLGGRDTETVADDGGAIAAFVIRSREEVTCSIEVRAIRRADDLFELTVLVANATPAAAKQNWLRKEALMNSLLSAHTVLGISGGEFISMIDPPADVREFAAGCQNIGTWPVLAGHENARNAMLSSPIILYDFPQVAPESAGDLFDGTEIDEILALRILTLTEDEKREVRTADDRAREVLERTESMPAEHFMKLHGVLRGTKPTDSSLPDARPEDRR